MTYSKDDNAVASSIVTHPSVSQKRTPLEEVVNAIRVEISDVEGTLIALEKKVEPFLIAQSDEVGDDMAVALDPNDEGLSPLTRELREQLFRIQNLGRIAEDMVHRVQI